MRIRTCQPGFPWYILNVREISSRMLYLRLVLPTFRRNQFSRAFLCRLRLCEQLYLHVYFTGDDCGIGDDCGRHSVNFISLDDASSSARQCRLARLYLSVPPFGCGTCLMVRVALASSVFELSPPFTDFPPASLRAVQNFPG